MRLLLAVGLGLGPTLATATAGTIPAFAGGGAGMTLTATMDGQDQRLLVGTRHTVHITLADTPSEADLRDITISLTDLDPHPLPVDCPAGQNGHLSLEPDQSLECTSVVTAELGFHTLLVRATAHVPSEGSLLRTAPLHYNGFIPPPPPPPPARIVPVPLPPDPAPGRPSRAPVVAPLPADPPARVDPPSRLDPPAPINPPARPVRVPEQAPVAPGCASGAGSTGDCCESHSTGCCSEHVAGSPRDSRCCGSGGKSSDCVRHGGLAFTGMSTPMLAGAAAGGLLMVAGGFVLVRRFGRR